MEHRTQGVWDGEEAENFWDRARVHQPHDHA